MSARQAQVAALILAAEVFAALVAPAPGRAAGELVPRSVMSSGATSASGVGMQLAGTVGQLVVGTSAAPGLAAGHGFWSFIAPPVLAIDPTSGPRQLPAAVEFGAPMPNPSRGTVAFDLGLPRAARVELRVVDLQGRAVAAPAMRSLAAGRHRLVLTTAGDAAMGPGVYFTRLLVDGQVSGIQRFVRIR